MPPSAWRSGTGGAVALEAGNRYRPSIWYPGDLRDAEVQLSQVMLPA